MHSRTHSEQFGCFSNLLNEMRNFLIKFREFMLKMQTRNYCQRLLENTPLEMEENSTVSFDVEGNLKFFHIKI